MSYSKGIWSVGKHGTVVTDSSEGFPENTGHSDKEYYGGFLICESIHKQADARLISAAPTMYLTLDAILANYSDKLRECDIAQINWIKSIVEGKTS